MKNRAKALFNDAIKKVKEADEELCRPEEDVVSVLICKKSQRATEGFLKGYLLYNGIDPSESNTLEDLYKQCKAFNKNFKNIDLSSFECKALDFDARQCDEISKVSNCYTTAEKLDTFLRDEQVIN